MRKAQTSITVLIILGLFSISCGDDDNPSSPGREVEDLWIDAHYVLYPSSPSYDAPSDGMVIIHEGSSSGLVVDNVNVTMNLETLVFDQSEAHYGGTVPGLMEGDNLTLTVVDGTSSMYETLNVPHAPSNLSLSGGYWDISNSTTTNTLSWDNPVDLGDFLVILIYSYDGSLGPMIRYIETDQVTNNSITIENSELAFYSSLDSVVCAVWQKKHTFLHDQSSVSEFAVMAGVAGKWEASN